MRRCYAVHFCADVAGYIIAQMLHSTVLHGYTSEFEGLGTQATITVYVLLLDYMLLRATIPRGCYTAMNRLCADALNNFAFDVDVIGWMVCLLSSSWIQCDTYSVVDVTEITVRETPKETMST